MFANTTELSSYLKNNARQLHDFFLRIKNATKFRPHNRPEKLPLAGIHQAVWLKNLACISYILASLLWLPNVYADTCQGINITGNISGKDAKVTVLDNSLISDENRRKMPIGHTFSIPMGSISKATIVSATTCSIAASSAGEITLTLTGATLKDVLVEGATVVFDDKSTTAVVNNIHGLLTGADIAIAHVDKTSSKDQQNDPLGLEKSTEVITLTKVTTLDMQTIPADLSLHYSASENGNYTLYTTTHPSQCWFFCSWRDKHPTVDDELFGDKTFRIPVKELKNKILLRSWTTGALVVPYKYTLASHSLAHGSLTVGPYAGYTTDVFGMQFTFPIAAGITKVTIPTIQNGAASTSDKFGLSIATGLLFNPGGNAGTIKTGILLGVDQLGSNSGYADNGKLWLGIYVGAGFGN